VIRLTRVGTSFQARKLEPELLDQATSKPRARSEAILDGLLSDATVLCEAEGDRLVYESVYRSFSDRSLDIRFVPSEGTGGFADPLRLYGALSVPTAIIADMDFLAKQGELRRVLTYLDVSELKVSELADRARVAVARLRASTSHTKPASIQVKLQKLAEFPADLTKDWDDRLRADLQKLVAELSSLHELRQNGIASVPIQHEEPGKMIALRADVEQLVSELREAGLFLVPVGELESWLPIFMKGHSRSDKSRWAILAAEKIEEVGERPNDVWRFMRQVYEFLGRQLVNTAG
jgi:hypothetical protein